MKSRSFWGVLALVVLLIAVVFAVASCFGIYRGAEIPGRIVAAFTSVAVTGVITWILLKGQRSEDERKDKNINIFQEKLKVYAEFNRELWKITDKVSLAELRDRIVKELVLMLPYDKMDSLEKYISELYENIEKEEYLNKFKSNITQILKDDITSDILQNEKRQQQNKNLDKGNAKRILQLVNAFNLEKTQADIDESQAETENHDMAVAFQDAKIQNIWQGYNEGKIQCWHFAALDNGKQAAALSREPAVLSLIEYGEDWRTERLEQVKKDDVLFLFNRGGAGYVGMYRATGEKFIIHNPAEGKPTVFEDGCEKELPEEKIAIANAIKPYDIYGAYDDGATYVSDVKVEEIKKLQSDTYNPINVVRQTIARLSPGNVKALLAYFDANK